MLPDSGRAGLAVSEAATGLLASRDDPGKPLAFMLDGPGCGVAPGSGSVSSTLVGGVALGSEPLSSILVDGVAPGGGPVSLGDFSGTGSRDGVAFSADIALRPNLASFSWFLRFLERPKIK